MLVSRLSFRVERLLHPVDGSSWFWTQCSMLWRLVLLLAARQRGELNIQDDADRAACITARGHK